MEAYIRTISDWKLQWDEWFGMVQSTLMPAFTPVGFEKRRAPEELWRPLYENYQKHIARFSDMDSPPLEGITRSRAMNDMPEDMRPLFISQPGLNDRVLRELKPVLEEWVRV